ncbi:MAG: DUF5666 domain-containing protein [Terriglobia bacterium]
MRRRSIVTEFAVLAIYAILVLPASMLAHGNEQHVMGTVAKIEAASITVKTTDGGMTTVMIVPDTKFVKGTSAASQKDLKVGDRVVIHAKPEGSMLHATEVRIGESKEPAQH